MKKLILALLLSTSAFAAERSCNLDTTLCNVKYNSLYDGDTIYVDIPSLHPLFRDKLGIRVKHIDTPEVRTSSAYEKAMAYKAKDFTEGLVKNAKKIDLVDCEKGKYFRLVCRVIADGVDVGCELIKKDYAVRYPGSEEYCK